MLTVEGKDRPDFDQFAVPVWKKMRVESQQHHRAEAKVVAPTKSGSSLYFPTISYVCDLMSFASGANAYAYLGSYLGDRSSTWRGVDFAPSAALQNVRRAAEVDDTNLWTDGV
jgi:hypothetical protein